MICKQIDLYDYFKVERKSAKGGILSIYVRTAPIEIKPKLRPAMLIIPGGAYIAVSDREAEPIALRFVTEGYSSFVLTYSTETAYPTPLIEACMAVIYIRENATAFNVDKDHIAAIGFSAGGHLAGMLATIYNEREVADVLGEKIKLARLNAVVLSYPVINMGQYTHTDTRRNITGGNLKIYDKLSVEKRVNINSTPAFIWHTVEDSMVPVENSLLLASAYKKAGVAFSLHLFEKGWHGLSLCDDEVHNQTEEDYKLEHVGKWFKLAIDWLKIRGFQVKVEE